MLPAMRAARIGSLVLMLLGIIGAGIHCSSSPAFSDQLPTLSLTPLPLDTSTTTPAPSATQALRPTPTLKETDLPTATITQAPSPSATGFPTATLTDIPSQTATDQPTPQPTFPNAVRTDTSRSLRVPILMYHHVLVPAPGTDAVGVDLSVPPEVFNAEVKFLSDQGFHSIHLTDVIASLQGQGALPPKPVVFTFDDGYDDNYVNAFPTLKDFGFVGTFFIISNRPDGSVPGYMTWSQIEEMASNGMEIGSHSLDHKYNLGDMPASVQWAEIKPSHDAVLQHVPGQPPVFAYPSGSYNLTTVRFLEQLGYMAAVTTKQGVVQFADDPLELHRIRIRGEWSVDEFVYYLNYWLGGL